MLLFWDGLRLTQWDTWGWLLTTRGIVNKTPGFLTYSGMKITCDGSDFCPLNVFIVNNRTYFCVYCANLEAKLDFWNWIKFKRFLKFPPGSKYQHFCNLSINNISESALSSTYYYSIKITVQLNSMLSRNMQSSLSPPFPPAEKKERVRSAYCVIT